ncbi:transglycosylase domain-containing protein [Streptomyces sp. NPDC003023]|uniref:transglycosylase domain-containing protein n=1 Tax=Streptomyces sp. NPDC003023 TaxID=3364675 RepID=UPI00368F845C
MGRAEARQARQRGARRAKKTGPSGIRRFFTFKKILGTFLGLCLLAMGAFFVAYMLVPVPAANAQAKQQSNVYKYSDGTILARTGEVNREIVGLDKIPKDVQYAFVAAENKTFFEDSGVDIKGTLRGLKNTVTGQGKQGGSTITQQYVKNYYLTQDRTITRKLKELVISLKVDRNSEKSEILAGYLNTSYFGRGAYGIQAASQAYYGIDAAKLNVAQGAYLAALVQSPSTYDWAVASDETKETVTNRWNYVLNNMVEESWLDKGTRDGLKFPTPGEPKAPSGLSGQAGYIVEAAKAELTRQGLDESDLEAGGWTITLNIDSKRQKELEAAVKKQLEDELDRKGNAVDATVQAGATSVDPKTGKVVALYGGVSATEHWVSNATRRDYQPASTFKPVVFASALENGSETQDGDPIGLNTVYDGTSKRPVVGSDVPFAPQNDLNKSYGDVTVQTSLNRSINSAFAQMAVDVGLGEVKETALEMGVPDKNFPERPSIALGTMGASTWDMAGVYATLDNHGKKVTPTIVAKAEHKDRELEVQQGIGSQVISRETADTVTAGLTGVVKSGSGIAAKSSAYEAAGKTGTSENNKSAWFAGYTPELATVVALFGETPPEKGSGQVSLTGTAQAGRANGGGFPARIWADYTLGALNGGSDAEFDLDVAEIASPEPDPTPTETETETADPTPTETETETADPTPTETETETADPTPTGDPTETATITPPTGTFTPPVETGDGEADRDQDRRPLEP